MDNKNNTPIEEEIVDPNNLRSTLVNEEDEDGPITLGVVNKTASNTLS